MKTAMSLLLAGVCLACCSCLGQKVDNSTVKSLDLGRYTGVWYEVARYDHCFERGMTHTKAVYTLNDDGSIIVTNRGMKKGKHKISTGKAKLTDTVGLLRVSFFGPFYSDYRVMMVSEDYNYALVGSGSSKYLWVLSRSAQVPEEVMRQILDVAKTRGYDISKLLWVDQVTDSVR